MTTILPPTDLAMLRSIARTAAVLLVCLRIDQAHPGRAIADWEVADILEFDRRTVQKQMRSLSAAGLVLEQREGRYVLTVAGRNTLFGVNRQPTSLSIEEPLKISAEAADARIVCVMNDDDDMTLESDSQSSSSITERTKCAQILEATYLLFGEAVSTAGLPADFNAEWALMWVAKAYRDRVRLSNPQGLIYNRIRNRVVPNDQMRRQSATDGLPDEYLDAIGRYEQTCGRCEQTFASLKDYQAHLEPCAFTPTVEHDEDSNEGVTPDETITASEREIWRNVLINLGGEMPRASFETWVRDTVPVHYEDGILQVAARNAYARDWLESRLPARVQELAGCRVAFVVAMETEE